MTDPIQNRPIRPYTPPDGVDAGKPAEAKPATPQKAFEIGGPTAPPPQQVEQQVLHHFGAVRSRIQDGLRRGLDKPQILQELARHELSDLFGGKVTDAAVKYVSDAVTSNPNLSQLFGKLFQMAAAEQNR